MIAPMMNPQPSTNRIRGEKMIITMIVAITPIAPAQPAPSSELSLGRGADRFDGAEAEVGSGGAGGGYHLPSEAFHHPGPDQLSVKVHRR